MELKLSEAPASHYQRHLIAEYARQLLAAENLAGPSMVNGTSGAQHQKPESKPPQGNPAGVRLCNALERRLSDHVREASDRVERAYLTSDAEGRENDKINTAYVFKLTVKDKRGIRAGTGRLVARLEERQ